jgi:hypothetical protein
VKDEAAGFLPPPYLLGDARIARIVDNTQNLVAMFRVTREVDGSA